MRSICVWRKNKWRDSSRWGRKRKNKKSKCKWLRKSRRRGKWGSFPFLTSRAMGTLSGFRSDVPMGLTLTEISCLTKKYKSCTTGSKQTKRLNLKTIRKDSLKYCTHSLPLPCKRWKISPWRMCLKVTRRSFWSRNFEGLLLVWTKFLHRDHLLVFSLLIW